MSNSIKKLLKGKGLLAELEDCRNEEEAIDVLKRENLWGIINYPELEELKESYKNGEIEADGTLSLNQLDKVAGGGNAPSKGKSKEKKQKQLNEGLGYAANAGVDVDADADANLDPANAIEREEAEQQEERERHFREITEQEQPELIKEDVQAWKEIEPIVKAIIEQNDGTLIINDLNPEDIFTNPEDPNVPCISFIQQGGELDRKEFRLVSMNFGDKSEVTYGQFIPEVKRKTIEEDCEKIRNEIEKKGENCEENIENDMKSNYETHKKGLSDLIDGLCSLVQRHPFREFEERNQGELMRLFDDAISECNSHVEEYTIESNEMIEYMKNDVRKMCADEEIMNEMYEYINHHNEYLNGKVDGVFMRTVQAPNGKTCFYMLDLECKMLERDSELKLMHHWNRMAELSDRYNSYIKENMEQIKEGVEYSISESFRNFQKKIEDRISEAYAHVNDYTRAMYIELTGNHEKNVDSVNVRTRLNKHIMLSIDLAKSRMKKGANCEAAELFKKVATIYVYLNDMESAIKYAIEALRQFKLGNNPTGVYDCFKVIVDTYSEKNCEKFYYKLTNKVTKEEIYEIYKILFEEYGYIRDFVTLETEQIEASCKHLTGDILLERAIVCAGLNRMPQAMQYAYLALIKSTDKNEEKKCCMLVIDTWSEEGEPRLEEFIHRLKIIFKDVDKVKLVLDYLVRERDKFAYKIIFGFNDNERKEFFSGDLRGMEDAIFRAAKIAVHFDKKDLAIECAIQLYRVTKDDKYIEFIVSMWRTEKDPTLEHLYWKLDEIASEKEILKATSCILCQLDDVERRLIYDKYYRAQFPFDNRDSHRCGNMLLKLARLSMKLGDKITATELNYIVLEKSPLEKQKIDSRLNIVRMWRDSPISEFRDYMGEFCRGRRDLYYDLMLEMHEKARKYAYILIEEGKNFEAGNKFYEIAVDMMQYCGKEMREEAIDLGLRALTLLEKAGMEDAELYDECLRRVTDEFRYYVREHNGEYPRRLLRDLGASEEQIDRIIRLNRFIRIKWGLEREW